VRVSMVSMCPYKWALYLIAVWAALYVMVEAALQLRGPSSTEKKSVSRAPSLRGGRGKRGMTDDEEDEDEFSDDDAAPARA
jgi:hypothetical protein